MHAKEDVANLLRAKCEWKVLVTRPAQDKYDNAKLFWTLKADAAPKRRTFTVQTSTHTKPTTVTMNKKGNDNTTKQQQHGNDNTIAQQLTTTNVQEKLICLRNTVKPHRPPGK